MRRIPFKIGMSNAARLGLVLALIFGIALLLRVYFPYEKIFAGDWVRFQINDPWWHMRQAENLVHHFPDRSMFDPYGFYPGGQRVDLAPFFSLFLSFVMYVIGLGAPSERVVETVGAYLPAVLGALVTLPVYFIGKELVNSKVGLFAAALVAILPGQFLMRTLLGFTDHHVAEILLSTLVMVFLMMAVKTSRQRVIPLAALRKEWPSLVKPLSYSLVAGVALGCYLLSWSGGALFVFVVFAYFVIQCIIDHLRGTPTGYLCLAGLPSFVVALVLVGPASGQYAYANLQVASLVIGILAFPTLSIGSFIMVRKSIRRGYYPLAVAAVSGIGLALFYAIDASLLASLLDKVSVLRPAGGALTISEVKGLSLAQAWDHFSMTFYLSLVSLAILGYATVRDGSPHRALLVVWSVVVLVAAIGQNRFTYYLAVNVALLTGYLCYRVLELVGNRETAGQPEARLTEGKADRRKSRTRRKERVARAPKYPRVRYAYGMVAIIVVFFLAFYPNIGRAVEWATTERGPNNDWHDALLWMRENTPEPFQDSDFYYGLYEVPAQGEGYSYPESAYGVMSWWDYGYWITYIGHRIPNTNPSAGKNNAYYAGSFFTGQDESSANMILDRMGSKYVVIDNLMVTSKFYAMALFARKSEADFADVYYLRSERGELAPVQVFYPEYYRSMCARLYNFGGKGWDPFQDWIEDHPEDKIQVISYVEKLDAKGTKYREISDAKGFSKYETAKSWVEAHPAYMIVGTNPLLSPVPLEELEHYRLVYGSRTEAGARGGEAIPLVQIFEYVP